MNIRMCFPPPSLKWSLGDDFIMNADQEPDWFNDSLWDFPSLKELRYLDCFITRSGLELRVIADNPYEARSATGCTFLEWELEETLKRGIAFVGMRGLE